MCFEVYIAIVHDFHLYSKGFEHAARAKIFKLLRSPRINSKESIPPAYVALPADTRQPCSYAVPSPHRLFKNSRTVSLENSITTWTRNRLLVIRTSLTTPPPPFV